MESYQDDLNLNQKRNINVLYLIEIFSGFARGSYLVCIGWTALVMSNSVATVGRIFIFASITNMLAGPVIGVLIDRHSRKKLICLAHTFIAFCMALAGFFLINLQDMSVAWLFLVVTIVISLTLMFRVSFDGVIRECLDDRNIITIVARTRGIHLFSTAVSTGLTGIVIDRYTPGMGFFISATSSLILVFVGLLLRESVRGKIGRQTDNNFLQELRGGLQIFRENRIVRLVGMLSIVVLPIGQLSNALLSSFGHLY